MARLIHPATGIVVEASEERALALSWPPADTPDPEGPADAPDLEDPVDAPDLEDPVEEAEPAPEKPTAKRKRAAKAKPDTSDPVW